jgi:threonine/homoserine/homoserine lactone efflux protein
MSFMPLPDLILALSVLLLTPGPTNTLMALAGAERGVRGASGLIAVEVCAYLCVAVPLAVAGAGMMAAAPGLVPLVTAAAAAWVLWLAIRMWRSPLPRQTTTLTVTPRRVFLTTLLNPKALIIGIGLLPGPALPLRVAVFAGLICGAALSWISLGALLACRGDAPVSGLSPLLRRSAAVWLGLLSAALAWRAVLA